MAKKSKKESEIVAFSVRLPKKLYEKLYSRAKDQKRSVNKESEIIFEKEFA
jgi:hypothetical protein